MSDKVLRKYLPAWDLCLVAFNATPANCKPVWWALFEAGRALSDLGDTDGNRRNPETAEKHLLAARFAANEAGLMSAGTPGEWVATPLAHAIDAALRSVRSLLPTKETSP